MSKECLPVPVHLYILNTLYTNFCVSDDIHKRKTNQDNKKRILKNIMKLYISIKALRYLLSNLICYTSQDNDV